MPDCAGSAVAVACRARDRSARRGEDFEIAMQVSFAPNRLKRALPRVGDNHVARPLLSPRGSRVVWVERRLRTGWHDQSFPARTRCSARVAPALQTNAARCLFAIPDITGC